MICLTGNRPVIQVGQHQIIGYETGWIDEALFQAAAQCNREDFPFITDIRNGIVHYLEHRCPLKVISIEKLYERMSGMLIRIGCQAIADHLTLVSPPLKLSLLSLAKECEIGYELFFHDILHKEIQDLRQRGVRELHLIGSKACTRLLKNCDTWDQHCEHFHKELIIHLHQIAKVPMENIEPMKIKHLDL